MKKNRDHLNLLCDIGDLANLLTESSNIDNFLNSTVRMVAKHLVADVCSVYLYDEKAGEIVLTATVGLNPEAVGNIRLKPGEGLVGITVQSAVPVCEGNVRRSHHYRYFKKSGEDPFKSFLAVPIQKGVAKIGALVVQHEQTDYFDEIDIKALRATASQLAGALETARLIIDLERQDETADSGIKKKTKHFFRGDAPGSGYAYAPATVFSKKRGVLLESESETDAEGTVEDFYIAMDKTARQLTELQDRFSKRLPESASLIFTAHFMILKDPSFKKKMLEKIEKGSSPAEAVRSVSRHYMAIFSKSSHAYIREKVNDVEDLAVRILRNMRHRDGDEITLGGKGIIVAQELYPSDILKLASEEVKAIILVSGGVTSHVSILSRSLQIPLVICDRPELLNIREGMPVLVDGEQGNIYLEPSELVVRQFEASYRSRMKTRASRESIKPETFTRDGVRVKLLANINLLSEVKLARELKAEGVGLYRTEFPFLIRSTFPSEAEQYLVYKRLFDGMEGKTVTIRTLDVGGEKMLSYAGTTSEVNPELGLRSIRFSLRYREIFEQQIRAVLRASADFSRPRIMFPMISSLDEFIEAKQVVLDCMDALEREKEPFNHEPVIGMMVEIPAVVDCMDDLACEADFFSIGTNDFVQYMLAVDRANKKVANYYQPYHPSVLRGLARITEAAIRENKDISVCGEMAHEPDYIPFLLGIGVRTLSVDPQFIPDIQSAIQGMDMGEVEKFASELMELRTLKSVRDFMKITE